MRTNEEIQAKIKELIAAGETDEQIVIKMDEFIEAEDKPTGGQAFAMTNIETAIKMLDEENIDKAEIKRLLEGALGKLKGSVNAALKDKSDDEIKSAAIECADTLRELNVMNGLLEDDGKQDLAEACDKVYAWLYDTAWMVPKDGWKIESKQKVKAEAKGVFAVAKDVILETIEELVSLSIHLDEEKEKKQFNEFENNVTENVGKAIDALNGAEKNFDLM